MDGCSLLLLVCARLCCFSPSVVQGYAAYLTIDLTMLIEGQEEDELPEVILGGCRLRKMDLAKPELRQRPTLMA